jgi:hypothetical protein
MYLYFYNYTTIFSYFTIKQFATDLTLLRGDFFVCYVTRAQN